MEIIGRLVKNASWLVLAQAIARAVGFAYALVLARFLGGVGFGQYSVIFTVIGFFSVIAEGGITTLIMRDVARNKEVARGYMSIGLVLSLGLGLISYLTLMGAVALLQYPKDISQLIMLAGISLIINNISGVFISLFNAFERMKIPALLSIVTSLTILATGISLLLNGFGLKATVYAVITASLVQLLVSGYLTTKTMALPSLSFLTSKGTEHLFSEALPYGLRAFLNIIYLKIAIVILSKMTHFGEVGNYSAAYKILEVLFAGIAIVNLVLFPLTSSLHLSSKEKLRFLFEKYTLYALVLSLPGLAILIYFSKEVLTLLYGAQFEGATSMLRLLIVALAIMYANAPLSNLVLSSDMQRRVLALSVLTAGSNVLLNLLLISRLGGEGAALATIGSELITTILFYRLVRLYLGKTTFLINIIKPSVSVLLASTVMVMVAPLSLILGFIAFLLTYILLLLMLRVFSSEDRDLISRAFRYFVVKAEPATLK